jgi:hypothetical protein
MRLRRPSKRSPVKYTATAGGAAAITWRTRRPVAGSCQLRSAPRITRRRIRSRPRFELAEEAAEDEKEEEAEEEDVARRCTWAIRLGGKKLTAANSSAPNRARVACFSSSPPSSYSYSSSSSSLAPSCAPIAPLVPLVPLVPLAPFAPFASMTMLSLLLV